jgi:hypothetical protein
MIGGSYIGSGYIGDTEGGVSGSSLGDLVATSTSIQGLANSTTMDGLPNTTVKA